MKNVGNKIKFFAKIKFLLLSITTFFSFLASVIIASFFQSAISKLWPSMNDLLSLIVLILLLNLISIILIYYISYLKSYGYGIIVDTCEKANEQIPEKINEPIKEIAKVEAKIEQPTVAKKIERKELSEEDVANRISTITIIVISILVVTLVTIAIMLLLK